VLQVLSGLNPCFPKEFTYKVISAMDVPWENLKKHFLPASKFIKNILQGGGSVLVHCYEGVSRSAAIVIAYLMLEHDMKMFEAMSFVK
jgi:protein-tyrosine phosphatase